MLSTRSVKTAAVLLAAVTLPCAAGVGASSALAAGTPTPTTQTAATRSGGATPAAAATPTAAPGTPGVPRVVPAAPARVRATVGRFALSAGTWSAGGAAPKISIRLDAARATSARVQVRFEDRGTGRIVLRQSFGLVQSGAVVQQAATPRLLALPGSYRLRVVARDQTGRRVSARARTLTVGAVAQATTKAAPGPAAPAAPAPAATGTYVFPVQGACNFRSLASQRFRAGRSGGRAHNGQDIGTFDGFPPVVAVTAATVDRVWFDDAGGGWTIVFNGDDGTAYGYLHLKAGSIVVAPGQRVAAGQTVANAGNTGGDYEPHLHFEMRPIPWDQHHDDAVDPMPLLSGLTNPCEG
jgi:murein DD-endopeptidase MepM/ murein hydrolase activator NlpD